MLGKALDDVTFIESSSQHMMTYFVEFVIPINQVEVHVKA